MRKHFVIDGGVIWSIYICTFCTALVTDPSPLALGATKMAIFLYDKALAVAHHIAAAALILPPTTTSLLLLLVQYVTETDSAFYTLRNYEPYFEVACAICSGMT